MTALKTLAMRIRGVKSELEEAGEDTTGLITNTSTLQAKIAALTNVDGEGGINILTNTGEFKSTYDILLEISKVWSQMNDMDQAALLEIVAGKRAGSVVAGILQNGDILENSYKDALNSDGSAMKELNTYLDSIQGKIDQFNNSTQTMWMNFMDSEVVKFFVDLAASIVKTTDKVGLLQVAVAAFFAKTAFNADSFGQFFKLDEATNKLSFSLKGAAVNAKGFGIATKAAAVGTQLLNSALSMLTSLGVSIIIGLLIKGFDALIKTTKEVAEAAEEATRAYSNSQSELSTMKSNIDALSDDYQKLASGVDEFGNNINLSTSQYERYNDIVNQIADMFPEMVRGYTAEGNAIIKNKGNVEALTKAYETLQSTANNTLLASADDIMKTYKHTFENKWYEDGPSTDAVKIKASRELANMLSSQDTYNFGKYFNNRDNEGVITSMVNLLEDAGLEEKSPWETSQDYVKRAIKEFPSVVQSVINVWESTANAAVSNVKPLVKAYLDTSVGYAGLDDKQKQVIDSMVSSLDEEFFNAFDGDASKLYVALESMIQNLKTSGLDSEYTLMLDVKASFNNDEMTIQEYQTQIDNFKAKLDSLVEQGLLSETDAKYIKLSLGIDEDSVRESFGTMVAYAQKIVDAESQDKVLTLTYSDLQIINSGNFEVPEGTLLTWEQLKQKIAEVRAAMPTDINTVQTYSALSDKASTYNDILNQTNEIVANNMEVTQEYKDSLSTLGITEQELSECFDENNELVVKNAQALRKLVAEKKKAVAADVKLAKSQSRLEYYALVQELTSALESTDQLNDATRNSISTTLEQLNVVEQAIYKYQLLEDSLLGTTNAFEEFAKAKDVDALNTYGDSYVEMVQTMYDGFYKTGEVGTEAFWAAVEHLVPTDVYQNLTEDADRIKAIYDYFNKTIAPSLTLDEDQFKFDFDAIENFVEKGLGAGVFTGDAETFDLVEGMNLKEASKLLGMTTAQAYAFFAELDKYNVSGNEHSFLSQLDDSTEGRIMVATTELENLNKQKLALLEDGGYEKHGKELDEINAKIKTQSEELDALSKKSAATWQEYSKVDSALSALNDIEDKTTILSEQEAIELGVKWQSNMTVDDAIKQLEAKKASLEEPTVLTAQLAQDYIQSELKALEDELGKDKFIALKAKVELDENGVYQVVGADSEEEKKNAQQLANLLNADKELATFLQTGLTTSETYLSGIKTVLEGIDGTLKGIGNKLGIEDTAGGEKNDTSGEEQNSSETPPPLKNKPHIIAFSDGSDPTVMYGPSYQDPATMSGGKTDDAVVEATNVEVIAPTSTQNKDKNEGERKFVGKATWEKQGGSDGTNDGTVVVEAETVHVGSSDEDGLSEGSGVHTASDGTTHGGSGRKFGENDAPKQNIDEEAVRDNMARARAAFEAFARIYSDPSVTYGEAYQDPATMSGGETDEAIVEAEHVEVATSTSTPSQSRTPTPVATPTNNQSQNGGQNSDSQEITPDGDVNVTTDAVNVDSLDAQDPFDEYRSLKYGDDKYGVEPASSSSVSNTKNGDKSTNDYNLIPDYLLTQMLLSKGIFGKANKNAADIWESMYYQLQQNKGDEEEYNPNQAVLSELAKIITGREELSQEEYDGLEDHLFNLYEALGLYTKEGWEALTKPSDSWINAGYGPGNETNLADYSIQYANELANKIQAFEDALSTNDFSKIDKQELGLEIDATVEEVRDEVEYQLGVLKSRGDLVANFILQVTSDEAQKQIDEFKAAQQDNVELTAVIGEVDKTGMDALGLTRNTDGTWSGLANITGYSQLDEESRSKLVEYLNLISAKHTIDAQLGDGVSNAENKLEAILDLFNYAYTLDVEASVDKSNVTSFIDWLKNKPISKTVSFFASKVGSIWNNIFGGKDDVNGTAHAKGTAFKGGSWGAPRTETALTGELGPELRVRGNRWELLGENGAEFNEVRKGDIIFNHKQTEDLLTNGYITGRGKAFAEGTVGGAAYSGLWKPTSPDDSLSNTAGTELGAAADALSSAAGKASDAADEFREVFDWIEVRLEEINERISLESAKLENTVGSSKQNAVIDEMIDLNQKLYNNLTAGATKYYAYAEKLLAKVPDEYRKAAQDGSIAIEEFVGETDEKTLEAIQEYREWVQKGADATQQAEETLTEISNLAKQAIDNIASEYENKASIPGFKMEQLEAYNALIETTLGAESADVYKKIIKENNKQIKLLSAQRNKMQAELNAQVEAGNIKKYSQAWYDAINDIAAVDTEIIELTTDTENYQDTINELHWEHFDNLLGRLEAVSNETENLIDILGSGDLIDKDTGEWTDEGITSLALYAQQMEVAEVQAKKYEEEINYLNKNWKKLGYTEQEYIEKLEELKNGQYDSIKAYNDTKDAIVDLNKERVDAIKDGIQKEIDAYEELISKKKEELDAEKD